MEYTFLCFFTVLYLQLVSADVDIKDLVPINIVNGTNLYTGIYYTLSMKSFPQGWVTWVDKAPNRYNIEVDIDSKALSKYNKGGPYEIDNQWTIGPSKKKGQYTLKNRRKCLGFLTYTSEKVGSGYHAAILEDPDSRRRLSPGGDWHNDALWMLTPDKSKRYHIIENVGYKTMKLTWSYEKYNNINYFIQIASFDAKDDNLFKFTPTAIKLVARISDFKFEENPEDVFRAKGNQKRVLVGKLRYINDSPVSIIKYIEETVQKKDSVTYSFTESFSMIYETSLEASVGIFKGSSSWTFNGGISATQTQNKETVRTLTLKDQINIPPHSDVEISLYNVLSNDVSLKFSAKMVVTGTTLRIVADDPTQTQDGFVPGDIIEAYIRATGGKKLHVISRTENSLEVRVEGRMRGNVGLFSVMRAEDLKKKKKMPEKVIPEVEVTSNGS